MWSLVKLTSDIKVYIFEFRRQRMKKKNLEDLLSVPFFLNLHHVAGFLRKGKISAVDSQSLLILFSNLARLSIFLNLTWRNFEGMWKKFWWNFEGILKARILALNKLFFNVQILFWRCSGKMSGVYVWRM